MTDVNCTVKFLPEDRSATVKQGSTLLKAASEAGVYVNSICGGDGVCGKCRLVIREGEVSAQPTTLLSREEIQQGYVLACLTSVKGNVTVEVPPESRLRGAPTLTSEDAVRFGTGKPGEKGEPFAFDPLCRKEHLELPQPSLADNLPDQERLYRELRKRREAPIMQMGLAVLRQLAQVVRDGDWSLTATLGKRGGTTEVMQIEHGDTSYSMYGLAVDIGTTTVVAHLVDLKDGRTLSTQAKYNSQIQYGEDVITRMQFASTPEGLKKLGACVADDVNNLVSALVTEAKIKLNDVLYLTCAGNTTMMHLLLGLDPANIRREPYIPSASYPPVVRAAEVGIRINPRGLLAWIPAVACYVGGDIVAGALVAGINVTDGPCMLIDMGTNGEIVLGDGDWFICCSASAGPAFEGGGIACGTRATVGAIERVVLAPGGEVVTIGVIGGEKPMGICGSGLIDLVAEMVRVGVLDRSGMLHRESSTRIRNRGGQLEFLLVESENTEHGRDIIITEADIQNFIRSKGAIYHAAECLLKHMGMEFSDLSRIYISGGFGTYLDPRKATTIGLLPDLPSDKFSFIGNGSVQGAKMALLSDQALKVAEDIAAKMTYFELSSDPEFMNNYTAALFLPHTDVEKFPSVMKEIESAPGN